MRTWVTCHAGRRGASLWKGLGAWLLGTSRGLVGPLFLKVNWTPKNKAKIPTKNKGPHLGSRCMVFWVWFGWGYEILAYIAIGVFHGSPSDDFLKNVQSSKMQFPIIAETWVWCEVTRYDKAHILTFVSCEGNLEGCWVWPHHLQHTLLQTQDLQPLKSLACPIHDMCLHLHIIYPYCCIRVRFIKKPSKI